MQPSDNRPQDASAAQGVPPTVYAMLVFDGEETGVYAADAETAMSFQYRVKRVYVLDGSFTDADLRAFCLEIQTGHVPPINNAFVWYVSVSDTDWPEMSHYITDGWGMITEDEHIAIVRAICFATSGRHDIANSIMGDLCRKLP